MSVTTTLLRRRPRKHVRHSPSPLMRKEACVCENLRPGMDSKKQIVLLGGHAHAQDTGDCPVGLRCIGTGQALRRQHHVQ